jgi:queuine tRNA-ribosyltransferase
MFELLKKDIDTMARLGRLHTARGVIETPTFMPVGTQGTVKALDRANFLKWGCRLYLAILITW